MEENKNKAIPVKNKPPEKESGAHPAVKTYAEDMAQVIEGDRGGLVKKLIHDAEAKSTEKKVLSPESKKNRLFMALGILLLTISFVLILFFLTQTKDNTVPLERQFTPLIFNDESSFIETGDFNKEEIIQLILSKASTTNVKDGGLEGIYLTRNNNIVGLREFISILEANFQPAPDLPSGDVLVSDNFLLGVVRDADQSASDRSQGLFILLKVRSIPDIFESLRDWEEKMFSDLHDLFEIELAPETEYLLTKDFTDGVVENKNARILYDDIGDLVLMYVFANDTSVIITNTKEITREIMARLASSQIKK